MAHGFSMTQEPKAGNKVNYNSNMGLGRMHIVPLMPPMQWNLSKNFQHINFNNLLMLYL